jgi:hypothetical protein
VRKIARLTHAEYLRERRKIKDVKCLSVELERGKVEKLELVLKAENKSKKQWLEEMIDSVTKQ